MFHQPTEKDPKLSLSQRCLAETLGTLLLVFFHAGSSALVKLHGHSTASMLDSADLVFLSLVKSGSLVLLLLALGKISGAHLNPAITLALAANRRFSRRQIIPYIASQYLGAVLGASLLVLLFGQPGATVGHLGAPSLSPAVDLVRGMLIEAIGAFVLMLTIRATAEDHRVPLGWAGIAIPIALGTVVLLIEPLTGASINPARAFGPYLLAGLFFGVSVNWLAYLIAYLIGPILGAVLAVYVYELIATPAHLGASR